MKAMFPLALVAIGALVACSSSSNDNKSDCGDLNSAKTVSITFTKTSGSMLCPDTFSTGNDGGSSSSSSDGGLGGCAPMVNGCSATLNCSIDSFTLSGSLTAKGNSLSGTGTVSYMGTSCDYSVAGTYQ